MAACLVAVLALVTVPLGRSATRLPAVAGASGSFIVMATGGQLTSAEHAVVSAGGRVERLLGVINGFEAEMPMSAAAAIVGSGAIAAVSPNYRVQPQAASYDPTTDAGSMYDLTRLTGAVNYWNAGYTGAGVGVALIDSGIAPVDGLADPSRVLDGPDLSFESQADNLIHLDTFGHGTHMAGIIGGRSSAVAPGTYATDTSHFLGMAPDSTIISLKVADAHGATDVSQVIAAIDWVVQHRNDPGLNIRVLNLSYGTDSSQAYTVDPLAYAAEQAWNAGIFVVAATGNAGFQDIKTSSMTSPAYDPNIMAVGASDPSGTAKSSDDKVASFSSTGNAQRRPDMVAPGAHVVSLRDPGSSIDQAYSSTGAVTGGLFRGSGTSQATAVMSGAAALVIQQRPTISPDQLKQLLKSSATSLKGMLREQQGAGELNLQKALTTKTPSPAPRSAASTGTGSLDAARGSSHLTADGVTLSGEQDIFGNPFDAASMAQVEAAGTAWSPDGVWNGSKWTGSKWTGSKWTGSKWTGSKWSGSDWSSVTWSSNAWDGSKWTGSKWTDADWTGSKWTDNVWADASWS